jgi:hypothetical protein
MTDNGREPVHVPVALAGGGIDFSTAAEHEIQGYVVRELSKLGLFIAELHSTRAYRGAPDASRTTPGTPDLALIGLGRCQLWEMKSASGSVTKPQKHFHAEAAARGYHIPVVRNLDDALLFYEQQFRQATRCPRCGYRV